jgi:hypothetical protein
MGSPVVRHIGKCWAFLCLREAGLLTPTEWQITSWWMGYHSLTEQWGLSHGSTWLLALGHFAL